MIVIGAAAGLLFGPDRIKSQLRESGVKNAFTGEGWKADQLDRINVSDHASTRALVQNSNALFVLSC